MTKTEEEVDLTPEQQERIEKRFKAASEQLSNRDRREAVKVFEANWEDLDEMDQTVVLVWIAEGRSKPLSDYDAMPMVELTEVMLGA